jgi:dTDP-4-amino-4,6-dideoxygalactose transaminase
MMNVPFLDLKAQSVSVRDEIAAAIQEVVAKSAFAGGPFVEQFETDFASFCQCHHAVGVSSGTAALWVALSGLGIGPGDEVITVPNTFIATVEAISFSGAKPVFVDIDKATYTMDSALLESAITPHTKAIIPVHLFGQVAEMDSIMDIAEKYGLVVVEDACQAHGASYKGKAAGSIGNAGCFSFYPGKNLGAYGEAGAVVTNDAELAHKIRMLRDHGQASKYHHNVIGWNARMDGLQGAVLRTKLKYLRRWNEARRTNAQIYNELLDGIQDLALPYETDHTKHVYHLYAIRVQDRDELGTALREKGIHCGIHYPIPIHLTEAYQYLGLERGRFPIAEEHADQLLSLPMFPELNRAQIEHVANEIKLIRHNDMVPIA